MPHPLSRPLSVLVVDDYPDAADALADLVGLLGHRARVARTGGEAVRLALQSPPDVVLLDLGLPDADGYAVAARLCGELDPRPLIVVVTGFTGTEGRSRYEGIDRHFVKPLEAADLEDLLRCHAEELSACRTPPPAGG